jgi:hypothetical protein
MIVYRLSGKTCRHGDKGVPSVRKFGGISTMIVYSLRGKTCHGDKGRMH